MVEIRELSAAECRSFQSALADVLVDCVEGGASVSFVAPFSKAAAEDFFKKTFDEVDRGNRILLAAFLDGKLVGTAQLVLAMPPNQPHRAEVAKLLVARSARGQRIGARLMEHIEQSARAAGKTLLVLDTETGGNAERLYQRAGWVRVGVIPNYAMLPDGKWGDTTIFWKRI